MDIHHLKVFRAAARASSFTVAAQEISLSQSTVSLHIKQLEDELGCALFIRSRKHVSLSDAGRALLPYVDRIFAELKNGELTAREFSLSRRGTIRLGTGDTPLIYLLPKVLAKFRLRFPLIEVLVTTEVTEVVLQQLLAQTVDLGIIMSPAEALKSVEALPLIQEELVIILSTEHPLANKSVLTAQDLSDLPFISHLRGTALRTVQQNYFNKLGVQPRIIMELENIEAIKSLVRAGMGVSVVPNCTTVEPYGHGLVPKRILNFPMSRQLLIAAKDWRSHPPATIRLARSIIQTLGGREALRVAAARIDIFNDLH